MTELPPPPVPARRRAALAGGALALLCALGVAVLASQASVWLVRYEAVPGSLEVRGDAGPFEPAFATGTRAAPCAIRAPRIAGGGGVARARGLEVRVLPGAELEVGEERTVTLRRGHFVIRATREWLLVAPLGAGLLSGEARVAIADGGPAEVVFLVDRGDLALGGRTFREGSAVRIDRRGSVRAIPWPRNGGESFPSAFLAGGATGRPPREVPDVPALRATRDARLRELNAQILGRVRAGEGARRPHLLAFVLETGDSGHQVEAASLAGLGDVVLLRDGLRGLAWAPDPAVSRASLRALARIGDLDVLPLLERGCARGDAVIQEIVALHYGVLLGAAGPSLGWVRAAMERFARPEGIRPGLGPETDSDPRWRAAMAAFRGEGKISAALAAELRDREATGSRGVLLALAEAARGEPARLRAWALADPHALLQVAVREGWRVPAAVLDDLCAPDRPPGVRAKALLLLGEERNPMAFRRAAGMGNGEPLALRVVAAQIRARAGDGSETRSLLQQLLREPWLPEAAALLDLWSGRGAVLPVLEAALDQRADLPPALLDLSFDDVGRLTKSDGRAADEASVQSLGAAIRAWRAADREWTRALTLAIDRNEGRRLWEALAEVDHRGGRAVLDALLELLERSPESDLPPAISAFERLFGRRVVAPDGTLPERRARALRMADRLMSAWRPAGEWILPE